MVVILEGSPSSHSGDQVSQLKPGDFVGFKSGSPEMHFLENTTNEIVKILVICSNPKNDSTVRD